MKRTLYIRRNIVLGIFLAVGICITAESCKGGKSCGCRGDLNSAYHPKKKFR